MTKLETSPVAFWISGFVILLAFVIRISDLLPAKRRTASYEPLSRPRCGPGQAGPAPRRVFQGQSPIRAGRDFQPGSSPRAKRAEQAGRRSEERRVGKECRAGGWG